MTKNTNKIILLFSFPMYLDIDNNSNSIGQLRPICRLQSTFTKLWQKRRTGRGRKTISVAFSSLDSQLWFTRPHGNHCRSYLFVASPSHIFHSVFSSTLTWLQYCRYGIKHSSIDQSINQSINQSISIQVSLRLLYSEGGGVILSRISGYSTSRVGGDFDGL